MGDRAPFLKLHSLFVMNYYSAENVTKLKKVMEQRVFLFSLIIEGTTEKVLQFKMPLMSIYNINFGFIEQKCIL